MTIWSKESLLKWILLSAFLQIAEATNKITETSNDQELNLPRFLIYLEPNAVIYDPKSGRKEVLKTDVDYVALDVCYEKNLLFYVDENNVKLNAASITDPEDSHEILHESEPTGLAVDWISHKLYYTTEQGRLEVSDFDGTLWTVLIFEEENSKMRSLALDPFRRYMYWVNTETLIPEKAWMDATHQERLVKDNYTPQALYLTVDLESGFVFLAEGNRIEGGSNQHIVRIDPISGKRDVIVEAIVHYLQVHQDFLYVFHHLEVGTFSRCNIRQNRCNLTEIRLRKKPMRFGVDFTTVYEPTMQPKELKNGLEPINSCEHSPCSHICLLRPIRDGEPDFSCRCPAGIRMHPDGRTCDRELSSVLLFAKGDDVRFISLDVPQSVHVPINVKKVERAIALDFDPVDKFIYWTDQDLYKIRRARIDGSGESDVIVGEVKGSDGVAVDWIARNLYWTDAVSDRIEVSRLNGSSRKTLVSNGLKNPRDIVLDPVKGFMFWSDWDDHYANNSKIEKAFLDGSHRMTLISQNGGWPNGLAIDREKDLIYWVDANLKLLQVASSIDGSGRRTLTSEGQVSKFPFGLSLLNDWLYWSDNWERSIYRIRVNGTLARKISMSEIMDVKDVTAVDLNYVPTGTNVCGRNNGGCSHLCLFRPENGPLCHCPTGWELSKDEHNCYRATAFILYTQIKLNDIMRISLQASPMNQFPLRLQNSYQPKVLDYDFEPGMIYWTEVDQHKVNYIKRARMNGSNEETIISVGKENIEGIAVDWIAKNIYWCLESQGLIEVSRLNGSSRNVIVWKHTKPRAIVVNPMEGFLYWTDWSAIPSIQRSALDGSHRTSLIRSKNAGEKFCSLALDYAAKRLYWTEIDENIGNYRIKSSDLSGGSIALIKEHDADYSTSSLYSPVNVYKDHLYVYNPGELAIEVLDKLNGDHVQFLHKDFSRTPSSATSVFSMKIVGHQEQQRTNPCSSFTECKHLCFSLLSDDGTRLVKSCGCPTHSTPSRISPGECFPPTDILLAAEKRKIHRWPLKSIGIGQERLLQDAPKFTLPLPNLREVSAIQYDSTNHILYYIDRIGEGGLRGLFMAALDNDKMSPIYVNKHVKNFPNNCDPSDIWLDQGTLQLFVICSNISSIELLRPIKQEPRFIYVGTVFHLEGFHPRFVSTSSIQNKLVFVDDSSGTAVHSRIVLCDFEGRNCKAQSVQVEPPKRVVLTDHDVIWIGPQSLHKISIRNFATDHSSVFLQKTAKDIAFYQSRILTIGDGALESKVVDIAEDAPSILEMKFLEPIIAVGAFSLNAEYVELQRQCRLRGCKDNEQCVIRGQVFHHRLECVCPQMEPTRTELGYTYDSKCNKKVSCSKWEFACLNGEECVHARLLCDGHSDCPDGSDEGLICSRCTLPGLTWPCRDGLKCISKEQHCNGVRNCDDNSDETHCRCAKPDQFFDCSAAGDESSNHQNSPPCIDIKFRCNKAQDCYNGFDEEGCKEFATEPFGTENILPRDHAGSKHNPLQYGLTIGGIVVFCLLLGISVYCCFRKRSPNNQLNITINHDPRTGTGSTVLNVNLSSENRAIGPVIPGGSIGFNNGSVFYSRAELTGKSSSSSAERNVRHFQSPGVPPNSDVSQSLGTTSRITDLSRSGGSSRRHHRRRSREHHHLHHVYPPPPPYEEFSGLQFREDTVVFRPPSTSTASAEPGPSHSIPRHRNRRKSSRESGGRKKKTKCRSRQPLKTLEEDYNSMQIQRHSVSSESEGSEESYLNPPPSPEEQDQEFSS